MYQCVCLSVTHYVLSVAPPTPVLVRSYSTKQSLGMVSWQCTDLPRLIDTLVTHSDITHLKSAVPCCLPAHLLFMCLRYADHCHDDQQTTMFIEGVADSLQKLTQVRNSFELVFVTFAFYSVAMTTVMC